MIEEWLRTKVVGEKWMVPCRKAFLPLGRSDHPAMHDVPSRNGLMATVRWLGLEFPQDIWLVTSLAPFV